MPSRKRNSWRHWDAFRRLTDTSTTDEPPIDAEWLVSRGINLGAPYLLADLRRHVLPLVRSLERRRLIVSYFFLVHDRSGGVPAPETDHGPYIHLKLVFRKPQKSIVELLEDPLWITRPIDDPYSGGHIDVNTLALGAVGLHELLSAQSWFVLRLIEAHKPETDPVTMLKHCHQFLHYFSNMLQMRVG